MLYNGPNYCLSISVCSGIELSDKYKFLWRLCLNVRTILYTGDSFRHLRLSNSESYNILLRKVYLLKY